jgi:flagellar protein FlbD
MRDGRFMAVADLGRGAYGMILVTRRDGSQFYINPELVQFVESTPDTVITLVDKSKLVVREPAEVIVKRFIEYQQKINHLRWTSGEAGQTGTDL